MDEFTMSYFSSLLASATWEAISWIGKSDAQARQEVLLRKLADTKSKLQLITSGQALRKDLKRIPVEVAKDRNAWGLGDEEQPVFKLLTDDVFQNLLADWILARNTKCGDEAKAILIKRMENALCSGGATAAQIRSYVNLYFEHFEKHVFGDSTLSAWLLDRQMAQLPRRVVDAQREERMADKRSEYSDFEEDYLGAIKTQYGYLRLLGIPELPDRRLPIDAGFISLSLAGEGDSGQARAAESVLAEYPKLVIEGDAGAGKTTLLQWEAVRCCDRDYHIGATRDEAMDKLKREEGRRAGPGLVPFFIKLRSLREKTEGRGDFPAFPEKKCWVELSAPQIEDPPPKGWLRHLIEQGRVLLLLDGLDELPPSKRPKFWQALDELLHANKNLCVRVTSRFFPRDGERGNQWQPPLDPTTGKSTPTVKVQPLKPERIDELIQQWHEAVVQAEPTEEMRALTAQEIAGYAETLKKELRKPKYRRIFELAETPFLCAAICLINRNWRQLLPEKRHELYRMLIVALLSLRDKMRGIHMDSPYDDLPEEVAVKLHARLAFDMMCGMRQNEEASDEDRRAYLIEAKRQDVLEWLREHIASIPALCESAEAESLLDDYLLPRCGLLREPSVGLLDFRHRALQEYLAGTAAVQTRRIDHLVNYAHDDRWHDAIVLAAGGYNVSEPEAIRLIEELVARGDREHLKICYALAVACLETAWGKVDTKTQRLVLEKLTELIPPKNSNDAKTLAAAGDHVVSLLSYEALDARDIDSMVACAETLARIGSEAARSQLQRGYWEDTRESVAIQVLRCAGIEALTMPAVRSNAGESGILVVPEFAREYVRDLAPLKELKSLTELELGDCDKVADLAPLKELTRLTTLSLEGCKNIVDLAPLAKLGHLRRLSLADCDGVANLAPLSELAHLEWLDLSRCAEIRDLAPLAKLKSLRVLRLRCCAGVSDLAPLTALERLESLDVAYCEGVKDLAAVHKLPNLRIVDRQGCGAPRFWPAKRTAAGTPEADFVEDVNGVDLGMIWIAGGTFQMGSADEGPVHEVTLGGFWMAATPITQAQYEAVMGKDPSHFKGADRPVESVSWHEAMAFCEALSKQCGRAYSLPSEAQWEYACRGAATTRFCFGDLETRVGHYAWYSANSGGETHPVGQKRPNAYGLYDMHGNVLEWCADWYGAYAQEAQRNPGGPDNGRGRVSRGGCYILNARLCRSACRNYAHPVYQLYDLGFRVVHVGRAQE